jgi:hypothetical protein
LRVDEEAPREVDLGGSIVKTWRMPAHPLFSLTISRNVPIPIPAGQHHVTLRATKSNALGIAFTAAFRGPAESTPADDTPAETAPPLAAAEPEADAAPELPDGSAGPELGEAPRSEESAPDAIAGVAEGLPAGESEPPPAEVLPDPVQLATNLWIVSPGGAVQAQSAAGKSERFWRVIAQAPLTIEATGPGTLRVDLRAHRKADLPQTLEPVIIGITVDEVLLRTLALRQNEDADWTVPGADFSLARRVGVALPLAGGIHRIQLSCSENAALGLSAFARLDTVVDEAVSIETDPLPVPVSVAAFEEDSALALSYSASAGAWLPTALPTVGVAATLETAVALPAVASGAGLGVSAGFFAASRRTLYADPRLAKGSGELALTLSAIPVLLDLRWRQSLAPLWLDVALGGGAVFAWTTSEAASRSITSAIQAQPAASAQAGVALPLGPGEIAARASVLVSREWSDARVRGMSAGGVSVGLAYRLAPEP